MSEITDRLFGILGAAESITYENGREFTQDEFGWRHSLDLLADGAEAYDKFDKDVELLNMLSTMPDSIADSLANADREPVGGDEDAMKVMFAKCFGDEWEESHSANCFATGWNAHACHAADQWVAVSERLPDEAGAYLFQQVGDDEMFDVYYHGVGDAGVRDITQKADYFRRQYVAWMPIPKYTPNGGNDGK